MPPTLLADPGPDQAQAAPATSWRVSGWPDGGRPEAFLTLDRGTATLAGSIVGRVDRRWRLLAATALPAGSDPGALLGLLDGLGNRLRQLLGEIFAELAAAAGHVVQSRIADDHQ